MDFSCGEVIGVMGALRADCSPSFEPGSVEGVMLFRHCAHCSPIVLSRATIPKDGWLGGQRAEPLAPVVIRESPIYLPLRGGVTGGSFQIGWGQGRPANPTCGGTTGEPVASK